MEYWKKVCFGLGTVILGSAGPLGADVKLPAIFGDHMVLQQGTKLPVWGTADAGEKVTVTVGKETGTATAGADGKWLVTLSPLPAGTAPVTMTVAGKNTLTFNDVLAGDVWVCSGQSNMEFNIVGAHNGRDAIMKANLPLLRLFLFPRKTSLTPLTDTTPIPQLPLVGHWIVCTPDNLRNLGFSAVGYFFGSEIQKTTGQPVGLIESSWGGTPAQAWTSVEKLASEPGLKHFVDSHAKLLADYPKAEEAFTAAQAAYPAQLAQWKQDNGLPVNANGPDINAANLKDKTEGKPQMPRQPSLADGGPGTAGNLFNGMIAPLIPYGIKGAIWYQGESNSGQADYVTLFSDMITDWRQRWGEGDFPFLFVQLAKFSNPNPGFAVIREAQLKTLALPNTGMASATDLGDQKNIHPGDKLDVGLRLALAAKHVAYGQNLVYSGPIYDKMQVEGGAARISFTQIGGGLIIGSAPWVSPGSQPLPTTSLIGFAIAGADKTWYPADAKIDGNTVVVSSAQVPQPVAVRYAFVDADGNLYNKEGLPASPFRTDDWAVTAPKPAVPPVVAGSPAPAPAPPPAPAK